MRKIPLVFMSAILLIYGCAGIRFLGQEGERAPQISGRFWINAGAYQNLSLKALRGKAVLVFFWTSSDSNSGSAARILNGWYEVYRDRGLEIIGVHSAEWGFGSEQSDVVRRTEDLGITFPVVLDEGGAIRAEWGELSWPAIFLVDRDGYIRFRYSGVLNYSQIEAMTEMIVSESGNAPRLRRHSVSDKGY